MGAALTAAGMLIAAIAAASVPAGASADEADAISVSAQASPTLSPSPSPSPTPAVMPKFILRRTGAQIAVFRYGSEQAAFVTEIDPDILPEADRISLEKGIEIYDGQALWQLIEDYSS